MALPLLHGPGERALVPSMPVWQLPVPGNALSLREVDQTTPQRPREFFMPTGLTHSVRGMIRRLGYDVVRRHPTPETRDSYPPDFDPALIDLCRTVRPYTMTSPERIFALRSAVEYLVRSCIQGSIVECGVWKGGSMMAVAHTLLELGDIERKLFLFDTFEGMSEPTELDRSFKGAAASDLLQAEEKGTEGGVWAYCPLEEVRRNMRSVGYPEERTVYIQGKVEETIPECAPARIALLRLDTDWYESTYHELVHLFPRLVVGGVLIIDDYGYWEGARRAVDQYFAEACPCLLFHRIDKTARVAVRLE